MEGMTSNLDKATCRHWHAKSALASAAERTIAGSTTAYPTHAHVRTHLQDPPDRLRKPPNVQQNESSFDVRSQLMQRILVHHSPDWNSWQELL